ncbi:unnamed protein product, partial [Protopolystoma xenopodis]
MVELIPIRRTYSHNLHHDEILFPPGFSASTYSKQTHYQAPPFAIPHPRPVFFSNNQTGLDSTPVTTITPTLPISIALGSGSGGDCNFDGSVVEGV